MSQISDLNRSRPLCQNPSTRIRCVASQINQYIYIECPDLMSDVSIAFLAYIDKLVKDAR